MTGGTHKPREREPLSKPLRDENQTESRKSNGIKSRETRPTQFCNGRTKIKLQQYLRDLNRTSSFFKTDTPSAGPYVALIFQKSISLFLIHIGPFNWKGWSLLVLEHVGPLAAHGDHTIVGERI